MMTYETVLKRTMTVGALFALSAGCTADDPASARSDRTASGDTYTLPTAKQLYDDSSYMQRLFTAKAAGADYSTGMPIDLADERQYQFIRNRMLANGVAPQSAPGLHAQLEASRTVAVKARQNSRGVSKAANQDQCGNFAIISDISDTTATITAKGTCFDGASYLYVDAQLWDENGTILGSDAVEDFGTELVVGLDLIAELPPGGGGTYKTAGGGGASPLMCDSTVVALDVSGTELRYYGCASATRNSFMDMAHPTDLRELCVDAQ